MSTKNAPLEKIPIYASALVGAIISYLERQCIRDQRMHDFEQQLLARGKYKTGFALCIGRRLTSVGISNVAREYVTNLIFTEIANKSPGVFYSSGISYGFFTLMRQLLAIHTHDSLELIPGIIEYWRNWNNSIAG